MTLLLILIFLILAALILVSSVNRIQRRERARRLQLRQLRLRHELMEEVMNCLLQTIPNRQIAKCVNDEMLDLLNELSHLERSNNTHTESTIRNIQSRSEELISKKGRSNTSFLKASDAQIAQTHLHLNQAAQILRKQYSRGKITDEELDVYLSDLGWGNLMVSVVSFIGQGSKASARGDLFSTHAFYKKAQHLLIESTHPEPKRMRMIKELGEIISGTRKTISEDLVPAEVLAF